MQDQTVRGRIGAASGKPGAWSRLSVVVSPEPAASFGAQVGRNSLSEELARQHGTAGRSAGLGGVASRSGEQGRGQGEGDGAVPSRIGEEGLFVGGENPFGKGGRGQGRRERLETVMARQKVVLCGLLTSCISSCRNKRRVSDSSTDSHGSNDVGRNKPSLGRLSTMGTGRSLDVSNPPKNRITLIRPMSSMCHVGERLFLWLAYIFRIPCSCVCRLCTVWNNR